jgi:hypothetical protein
MLFLRSSRLAVVGGLALVCGPPLPAVEPVTPKTDPKAGAILDVFEDCP